MEDTEGNNITSRPIGSKKAKFKRKTTEGNNMAADTLISSNEQILDLLKESAISREKSHEMIELRMQNEAKRLALKEAKEENKILLKDLASIVILILVSTFILNKKESYEKTPRTTTTTIFGYTKFVWTIF